MLLARHVGHEPGRWLACGDRPKRVSSTVPYVAWPRHCGGTKAPSSPSEPSR